uniref:Uncharacterized protein n=1 Tax=Neobodo designis TaxID=312471 RepID=A0A7S1M9Z8_NEODS|mmetsp:Transcript_36748/g.113333  ORF Transcript_36748/g.113333 Transcript_36748/m.113333 type:complete len:541 (+) Transcript_36748:58-1680(+)|eukprot:CAMPEP_0174837550 /NCGR_PEP_ID=MMETSP1114-20130205/6819_1 /TAXON_ID=312471 /ORGANISM="Neobodo designis, Strain CCAP 1951/1" /LENGTH=540 /DNA_ID=CAMNT_0016071617 /DNA_START=58 /DNA_END=1680 /DNA_ORIENTATION=+
MTVVPLDKDERVRRRLVRFYRRHAPSRLRNVPHIVEKYGGDETRLFQLLAEKYHVDPAVLAADEANDAAVDRLRAESAPWLSIAGLDHAMLRVADAAGIRECQAQLPWAPPPLDTPVPPTSRLTDNGDDAIDRLAPALAGEIFLMMVTYVIVAFFVLRRMYRRRRQEALADHSERIAAARRHMTFRRRVLQPGRSADAIHGMVAVGGQVALMWFPMGVAVAAPDVSESPMGNLAALVAAIAVSAFMGGLQAGAMAARDTMWGGEAPEPLPFVMWYGVFGGPLTLAAVTMIALRTACASFTTLAQVPCVVVASLGVVAVALVAGSFVGFRLALVHLRKQVSWDATGDAEAAMVCKEASESEVVAHRYVALVSGQRLLALAVALAIPPSVILVAVTGGPNAVAAATTRNGEMGAIIACYAASVVVPAIGNGLLLTAAHLENGASDWRWFALRLGCAPVTALAIVQLAALVFFPNAVTISATPLPSANSDDVPFRVLLVAPAIYYAAALIGITTTTVFATTVVHTFFGITPRRDAKPAAATAL